MEAYRFVNVGCGEDPIDGWLNLDNSFGIKIARKPLLTKLITALGLLNSQQIHYISSIRNNSVKVVWANACKKIPCQNNSIEILYSCNMLEHLTKQEAILFLKEAKRVLITGGILRIAVPDLEFCIEQYMKLKDANRFMESLSCCVEDDTFAQRLKLALFGARNHKWMYDQKSLIDLLVKHDFRNPIVLKPGETRIKDTHGLNLLEHAGYTLYIESTK